MRRKPDGDAFVVGNIPDNTKGKKLRRVNGIAAGPDGAIYVAGNHTIRKLTKEGTVSTVVGPLSTIPECASIPGVKAGWLPYLRSLVADASGTVWVAVEGCGAVLKIPAGGEAKAILKTEAPWSPTAVTLAGTDLYVLEVLHTTGKPRTWIPRVRKITADGRSELVFTLDRDSEKAKAARR
jgi:sugar lactone lactonase YvrE